MRNRGRSSLQVGLTRSIVCAYIKCVSIPQHIPAFASRRTNQHLAAMSTTQHVHTRSRTSYDYVYSRRHRQHAHDRDLSESFSCQQCLREHLQTIEEALRTRSGAEASTQGFLRLWCDVLGTEDDFQQWVVANDAIRDLQLFDLTFSPLL